MSPALGMARFKQFQERFKYLKLEEYSTPLRIYKPPGALNLFRERINTSSFFILINISEMTSA
jgi:hypothetical protein